MAIPTQAQLLKQFPEIRYIDNREYGFFVRIMQDPANAEVPNLVEKALQKATANRSRESLKFIVTEA